jgi:hypothetical protein
MSTLSHVNISTQTENDESLKQDKSGRRDCFHARTAN